MKVLYVAGRWDPKDHNQASGVDYEIHGALVREGADVDVVGPFSYPFSKYEVLLRGVNKRLFGTDLFKYPISYFQKSASTVNQALNEQHYDLVVSLYSAPIFYAKLNKPFLYICDASAKWVQQNWKKWAWVTYETMYRWERSVIKKASHVITLSDANAKVLGKYYRVPENRLSVFPMPASIPQDIVPDSLPEKKELLPLKLLLVGRYYERKGIDIAIEINEILKSRGIDSQLRIMGLTGEDQEGISFLGYFNKTNPQELQAYIENYRWANFLLHPARFEAAGIVPSEAAAFGVPTLTNDAGGLATTVKDGISGIVLPKASPPEVYVEKVIEFINNPDAYYTLVKTTKERYRQELNWGVLGEKIFKIAEKLTS